MKKVSLIKILDKIKKKNIAIIGHMGSGKSVFAGKIANHYGIQHLDSDKEIIKYEKSSINNIFSKKGESYFREIESNIVIKILKKRNIIVSLGGGSILTKKIRDELKKQSLTLFLDVKMEVLFNRLKKSKNRPLLKDKNILTTIKQLDGQRRKFFLNADIIIDNSDTTNITFTNFIKILTNLND